MRCRCHGSERDEVGEKDAAREWSGSVKNRLLCFDDVPKHLQFNPFIWSGYRPLLTWSECIMSLFYWHNETLNIATHGIPFLFLFLCIPNMLPWEQITVPVLPYTHIVATMSPWLGSFIYHLFMNHKSGEQLYYRLLQIDMLGIWVTQSLGALTTVYASIFCLSSPFKRSVLLLYCFLSFISLYKALIASDPWQRRLSFTLQFICRLVLLVVRLSPAGGGHPDSVVHVILQDLLSVIGGTIGALRVPERWLPGQVDTVGNSHHIMHVLVVVGIIHMHIAARQDLIWMSTVGCSGR